MSDPEELTFSIGLFGKLSKMKRLLFLIVLVAVTQYALAQQTINETQRYELVGEPFRVHGRLSVYCGNPSCRIWIVGTNRILGIREIEEKSLIPPDLLQILQEDINDRLIYADFVVSPLTKYKEGVMQIVKVESAENVIVTKRDMRFLKRVTGIIK
jgi:hypothetical protein